MRSGVWRIIVSGNQLAVQRSITLTVGIPQTVVVTVSRMFLPYLKQAKTWRPVADLSTGHTNNRAGHHQHSQGAEYETPAPPP